MKASDVIIQLASVLPGLTDLFSTTVAVTSLVRAGSTVTATTVTDHGLTTGDEVTITGSTAPNSIISLTQVDNIATATTAGNHDLTEGFQQNVEITGADQPEYNGTNKLLTVPNRRTFTYMIADDPVSPATGAIFLQETLLFGYNGRFVTTVTSLTEFEYTVTGTPGSPATGSPIINTEIRVSGAVSPDRAVDAYTAQQLTDLWAFVVVDDTDISRDRAILNDANVNMGRAGSNRIRVIENFSVYVFAPSIDSIAGREPRDLMDDIARLFYNALVGVVLPSNLSEERRFMVTPNGDGIFLYTGSFYIHRFMFQTVKDICTADIFDPLGNVAFRDIRLTTFNSFDEILTDVTADLDDEPL